MYVIDRRVWFASREDLNFPRHFVYRDGRIWCSFTQGRHGRFERSYFMISEDGGQTWLTDLSFPIDHHIHFMNRLKDGHLLCWGETGILSEDIYGSDKWNFGGSRYFEAALSWDEGRTWTVKRMPVEPRWGNVVAYNQLVELPDGTLLQASYGDDYTPDEKHEQMVLSLRPDENTWRYRGQMFQRDPGAGVQRTCEGAMVALPDGTLVCVVRTEEGDRHVRIAESKDQGFTWATIGSFPYWGVSPQLELMPDGRLVMIVGAREDALLSSKVMAYTSADGGHSWSEPCVVYDGPGSGYPCMVPTGKDRLLVSWAESYFVVGSGPQYSEPGKLNKICAGTLVLE